MRKIGVLGGTFDPIHNGHLNIAQAAYREYHLDQVWFMPNAHPPHKSADSIEANGRTRLDMVEAAIKGYPYFRVEECEVFQKRTCYSYSTMESLQQAHPEDRFFFIIGADSLFSITSWRHPERLFKACIILAAVRDEMDEQDITESIRELEDSYQADIRLLHSDAITVSSTEIKERVKEGGSIEGMVPENVARYIYEHHLFVKS